LTAAFGFHAKAAIRARATRAELLETLSMAIYMGAGPSMIYASEALRAFDELSPRAKPASVEG
jgi:alkylhydroperoxidase/carboxymuconolactone decarboxylase family protein YurZ